MLDLFRIVVAFKKQLLERDLDAQTKKAVRLGEELAKAKARVVDLENQLEETLNRNRADE